MTINLTWLLGTILILLMQIAFVRWQMRYLRSFDRLFGQGCQTAEAPSDPSDAELPA